MRRRVTDYELKIFLIKKQMESMSIDDLENIIDENAGRPDSLGIRDHARALIRMKTCGKEAR